MLKAVNLRFDKKGAELPFWLLDSRSDSEATGGGDILIVSRVEPGPSRSTQLFRFPRQTLSEHYAVNQRLCFRAKILDPAVRGAMPWWEIGIGLFHCQMPLGHQAEIGTKSDAIQD